MNPTFKYVEEYLEFIGGHRDSAGKLLGMFDTVPCPLSLARYDVQVVESLASQTAEMNNPYTDKQAALAVKIVDKYRRQLAALKPSIVVPELLDQFKLGIRKIDRTKRLEIKDSLFIMRFPYDTKLIDLMKVQVREGNGSAAFDHDEKVWKLAMTESMLSWAVCVATMHNFEIDPAVAALNEKLLAAEQQKYAIELDVEGQQFVIKNATDSLVDYINEHLGGFGLDNALTLVDNSEVLGYTLSDDVMYAMSKQYDADVWRLISQRKAQLDKRVVTMDQVVDYARLVNRLPVYVYDTGMPRADTPEIKYLNKGKDVSAKHKLLVTTTGLMIGTKKQGWLTNAEKIIILE